MKPKFQTPKLSLLVITRRRTKPALFTSNSSAYHNRDFLIKDHKSNNTTLKNEIRKTQ